MKTPMTSREYLLKVLSRWNEFCRAHKRIEKAIRETLAENERLSEQVDILLTENKVTERMLRDAWKRIDELDALLEEKGGTKDGLK